MHRLLGTLLLVLAPLAGAKDVITPEEARAVREVIQLQLDAFQRDDAERAFSLATPGIRAAFGNAESFMDMVRRSYAVVYRPKSIAFDDPILFNGELIQPVRLSDAEGGSWLAIYPMQKQPDGSWRTNGCQLARLPGTRTERPGIA